MTRKVFLIMRFESPFFELQENLAEEFSDFEFLNVGEVDSQKNILQDIIESIYNADVILADLTGLNSNVYYELGIAHSFNKRVIQITQNIEELPFDIKQYRTLEYGSDYRVFKQFIKKLRLLLESVVEGEDLFSNPVNDFLKNADNLDLNTIRKENMISEEFDEEDTGFLDHLSDMEESIESFTKHINSIAQGIAGLAEKMDNVTKDIERVKKIGGSGVTSYIKKQADKISKDIDGLVKTMDISNEGILRDWQRVEISVLGIIESKFMENPDNQKEMKLLINQILDFKINIESTNDKVSSYKDSINNIVGTSRNLTKSARKLTQSTETYLEGTGIILSSIEKIDRKSKFIAI